MDEQNFTPFFNVELFGTLDLTEVVVKMYNLVVYKTLDSLQTRRRWVWRLGWPQPPNFLAKMHFFVNFLAKFG